MDKLHRVLEVLNEKLAEQIRIIDMRQACSYTDYFVIVTAKNPRHLMSLLSDVEKELSLFPGDFHREGQAESSWLLLDAKDFLVHFFLEESRNQFRLEALWADQPSYSLEDYFSCDQS